MSTIRVERVIAADPTGTALLLAGRTALDLWPGVTRLSESGTSPAGALVVEAALPALRPRAARVSVRARPPRRLVTSYVTTFRFVGEGVPDTEGTVTLTRSNASVHAATDAVLTLAWEGSDARVTSAFRAMADGFLANLAAAAEERAYAA